MAEKDDFEAAVAAETDKRIAAMQAQWAAHMETAIQASLQQVEEARMRYEVAEQDAANARDIHRATLRQAEEEGQRMALQYLEERRAALTETAQMALLHKLARKHLEAGHTVEEVAHWLDMEPTEVQGLASDIEKMLPLTTVDEHLRRLSYRDEGRSGTIWYEDGRVKFSLWWEFGGSPDVLVFIDVPAPERWEAYTGLPLADRANVLRFIATRVIRDKCAAQHRFSVGQSSVVIYQ